MVSYILIRIRFTVDVSKLCWLCSIHSKILQTCMKRKGIKESDPYDWEKSTTDHNTSISSVPTGTTVKQANQQKQTG